MYGFVTIILLVLLTLTLCGTTQVILTPSPCHVESDLLYNGLLVNCQHQAISSLPLPQHWLPPNITSLLLDFNVITYLNMDSFASSIWDRTSVRLLSLSFNQICSISGDVFSQFVSLQRLDISNNRLNLDRVSLNGQVFRGLENLMEISLQENSNSEREGAYNESLFSELVALRKVRLDTFIGDLHFGSLFRNTRNLSILELSGGVMSITNKSFEGFDFIQLTQLKIVHAHTLRHIEPGAFQPLNSLDLFQMSDAELGINTTLESLAPFVKKNMREIIISGLKYPFQESKDFARNSVMTRNMTRYLSEICVQSFILTRVFVFIIETNALTSETWRRCLKYLEIARNPLNGEKTEFLRMLTMPNLIYVRITDRKYTFSSKRSMYLWKPSKCMAKSEHIHSLSSYPYDTTPVDEMNNDDEKQLPINTNTNEGVSSLSLYGADKMNTQAGGSSWSHHEPGSLRSTGAVSSSRPYGNKTSQRSKLMPIEASSTLANEGQYERKDNIENQRGPTIWFPFPPKCKVAILNCNSYKFGELHSLHFTGGENLVEFHVADNSIRNFDISVQGLTSLKVLDISKNDGSVLSAKFFDTMSTISHLNMAEMKLDMRFMADFSKRLFLHLSNLSTLDLSDNDLLYLTKDTFATNAKLCVLNLKGNRFELIPFDLIHVPKLSHLDMRGNSLKLLSNREIASLNNHFEQTGLLYLGLDGNEFDCGCQGLRFLSWLQRTRISLDNNGNYTCFLDSGQLTTTGNLDDLDIVWRKCHGENAFWITLTLACSMILGYLCCFVVPKFKTQLRAIILKTFWIPFNMKTPVDFPIGVYIGYADQETRLACGRLRPFIEDKLRLTTYVRHRDLLPAADMAESIMEAILSSWRVLLVVSDHFLEDPWSFYVMKASTYAVQADNPGRIVLALIDVDDRVISKLPDCVLRGVKEESIIMMTSTGNISYEDKEALKTALIYKP